MYINLKGEIIVYGFVHFKQIASNKKFYMKNLVGFLFIFGVFETYRHCRNVLGKKYNELKVALKRHWEKMGL